MDQLHTEKQRGIEAQQVLDNPAFQDAIATLKDEITRQWRACPVRDQEGQLLLLQLAKLTDKFEGILMGLIMRGDFAAHKLIDNDLRNESAARRALRRVL